MSKPISLPVEKEPGRLIGYARVSTDDQTLDPQIDALLKYGVPRKNIYADRLVVIRLDRLCRDLGDLVRALEGLKDRGSGLVSDNIRTEIKNGRPRALTKADEERMVRTSFKRPHGVTLAEHAAKFGVHLQTLRNARFRARENAKKEKAEIEAQLVAISDRQRELRPAIMSPQGTRAQRDWLDKQNAALGASKEALRHDLWTIEHQHCTPAGEDCAGRGAGCVTNV